jgi:hypothetical protein
MDKMVYCDDKAPDGTHYNDPPKGMIKITAEDFARSIFFTYTPTHMEYRQIHAKSRENCVPVEKPWGGVVISAKIFWMHDGTGIVMESESVPGRDKKGFYTTEYKVNYYHVGCQHDYRELGQKECAEKKLTHHGQHWHVCECTKCHYIWSYDSSG